MYRRWVLALAILGVSGCSQRIERPAVLTPDKVIVAPGETVYLIAYKHCIPVKQLIAYNDLLPPYVLRPGDILVIPPKGGEKIPEPSVDKPVFSSISVPRHPLQVQKDDNPGATSVLPDSEKPKIILKTQDLVAELHREKAKLRVTEPPFPWPLKPNKIVEYRRGGKREGMFLYAKQGAYVKACHRGKIFFVGEAEALGCIVIVEGDNRWLSVYGNISSPYVSIGQEVNDGSPLGLVGSSARGHGPHVYLEIRRRMADSKRTLIMDPQDHLEKMSTSTQIRIPGS